MNPSYDLLQKQAGDDRQLYTLMRFACNSDHVTAMTMNSFEAATVFLSAECSTIRMLSLTPADDKVRELYSDLAKTVEADITFEQQKDDIEPTDLLYINTPGEGNYRASELAKYANKVRNFIILPNTKQHGHTPSPQIKLADGMQPIGLIYGINHFLQNADNWFILEHDDDGAGITVLVNRDNVEC